MPKLTSKFICQQCGYESPKYLGRCPNCDEWNSFVETTVSTQVKSSKLKVKSSQTKPIALSSIQTSETKRISTGIAQLDEVLGGGLVPGQVVLLAGEPGVGKSTLLLQMAKSVAAPETQARTSLAATLYISGEESVEQLSLRAKRLGITGADAERIQLLAETNVDAIIQHIANSQQSTGEKVDNLPFVIVDSIQTLWTEDLTGAAGSVGQVRECAYRLIQHVKANRIPLIIVGQVTKEGTIAGPKVLEHLVDTVLSMEGLRYEDTRLLRVTKNRFGPTDELGVFTMQENGLVAVDNPSENFLTKRTEAAPGQAVVVLMEGTRPLLVEVQALVTSTELAIPRRVGNGIANARLSMIAAILTKHLRLPLGRFDIFVNVSGGFVVREPAADLGIALAIYTSLKNKPLSQQTACIGELSLLGEIVAPAQMARRIKEAKRLGFSRVLSSETTPALSQLVKAV